MSVSNGRADWSIQGKTMVNVKLRKNIIFLKKGKRVISFENLEFF